MNKTSVRCVFLAALAMGLSVPASAGDLKLSMQDGRVTIIADNVPLRQILQEWSRVGHAEIVNADKLNGPAMTLQLINAPERDALEILLRSASGYIAAPRPVAMAGAAIYDRITIMATSHPPAATAANASTPPTFQRPPLLADPEDPPMSFSMPPPPSPNPVVGQFPGMLPPQPGQQFGAPNMPSAPQTSPRPGLLPAPTPNGVPNPYQPVVIRPGGGGPGGPGGI